jgi:hypothetical protein
MLILECVRQQYQGFITIPTTHQCEQFTWGGCADFPFETMQACEDACE